MAASDQQMQQYANQRIRVRAEQLVIIDGNNSPSLS